MNREKSCEGDALDTMEHLAIPKHSGFLRPLNLAKMEISTIRGYILYQLMNTSVERRVLA